MPTDDPTYRNYSTFFQNSTVASWSNESISGSRSMPEQYYETSDYVSYVERMRQQLHSRGPQSRIEDQPISVDKSRSFVISCPHCYVQQWALWMGYFEQVGIYVAYACFECRRQFAWCGGSPRRDLNPLRRVSRHITFCHAPPRSGSIAIRQGYRGIDNSNTFFGTSYSPYPYI